MYKDQAGCYVDEPHIAKN